MTPTPLQRNEKILTSFWKILEDNQFVKSTNSVTGKVEEHEKAIIDMEETVTINGEFDKPGIEERILKLLATQRQEVLEEVEREAENMWSNVWFPGGALEQKNKFLKLVVKIITSLKQRP